MPLPNQPIDTPIPPQLNRWNWGAFLMNWIWGLGNSTFIALLMFVPLVNIVMFFVLGAKGSKWAWKNRLWESEEHFKSNQRKWAIAGVVVWCGAFFLVGVIVFGISAALKGSDAQKFAMTKLLSDPQVIAALGEPIEAGWFTSGNISIKPGTGSANISIPISGPKGSGRAITQAKKIGETWEIFMLVVKIDGIPTPIVLINTQNLPIPGAGLET